MTNGNKFNSFIHFLQVTGEFNKAQSNCFRHAADMLLKEMLVDMGIFSNEHVSYLWQQYIRGKVNNYLKEGNDDL